MLEYFTAALREGDATQHGEYELRYSTVDVGASKPQHLIEAHHSDDGRVGFLRWMGSAPFAVDRIEVSPDHQRQGLASAMWSWAQDNARPKPRHSRQRTEQGDAWARSVGGPLPRRQSRRITAGVPSDPGYVDISDYFGGGHGGTAPGHRVAGRGKPRARQRPDGQGGPGGAPAAPGGGEGGSPAGQQRGEADEGGGRLEGPRPVEFHPGAHKDLKALDRPVQKQIKGVIDALANGEQGLQTHALSEKLKGWYSTKASRGHRVVHRNSDDGGIHIGYVGLHDYDKAIRRLTKLTREPGPVSFPYLRYHDGPKPEGDRWETGMASFENPLHLDRGGNYGTPENWKNRLSEQFGGKKGKALSRAVVKAGHDGIITHDEYGPDEIVDLTSFRKKAMRKEPIRRCPCGMDVIFDPQDGWQHADGSVSHDGEHYGKSVSDLMKTAVKPRPTGKLPQEEGLYWRLHRKGRPFSREDATSQVFYKPDEPYEDDFDDPDDYKAAHEQWTDLTSAKPGYSSYASPHHVEQYAQQRNLETGDSDVVAFHGKQVGYGNDDEPLVMPHHDKPFMRMPYREFQRRLRRTKKPWNDLELSEDDTGGYYDEDGLGGYFGVRAAREDELPAEPGTAPIPEGHIRLWHYTSMDNVPSIREQGVLRNRARSDLGNGDLSQPSAGVWASTARPEEALQHHSGRGVIEFHAHPSEISHQADHYQSQDPQEWARGTHHVIMKGDVVPSQIVAVHEPWHSLARYMQMRDPSLERYQSVRAEYAKDPSKDHLEPYARALDALERQRRRTAAHPRPTSRVFGPTYGLDHRLFTGEKLKPEVRTAVLARLGPVIEPLLGEDWKRYTRVYLAGSEASEWTSATLEGNGDFDTLIGVDYDHIGGEPGVPVAGMDDDDINDLLNKALRENYNASPWKAPFGGEWDLTGYVNANSFDITKIKPYAAYNITNDEWAVRPPTLPDNSLEHFPKAVRDELEAADAFARAVLALPEPMRTQQGAALWDYLHSERRRAFSDRGEGWADPSNLIEKWADQVGWWDELLALKRRWDAGEGRAPSDWSNEHPYGGVATGARVRGSVRGVESRPGAQSSQGSYFGEDPFAVTGSVWVPEGEHREGERHVGASAGAGRLRGAEASHNGDEALGRRQGEQRSRESRLWHRLGEQFRRRKEPKAGSFSQDGMREQASLHGGEHPYHEGGMAEVPHLSSRAGSGATEGLTAAHQEPWIEHVRVDKLLPHREWQHQRGGFSYDMEGDGPYAGKHDAESWDANKRSVAEQGIQHPLTLEYNPTTHSAYLGEGNHRLHWAHELGHETVPVRMWRTSKDMPERYRIQGEPKLTKDENGYFPQDGFKPSDVLPADYFPGQGKTAGAQGDLPDLTFRHLPPEDNHPYGGADQDTHTLHAYTRDGKHAGELSWFGEDGMIRDVGVHPDYRRRGIASELLHRARQIQPDVHHSDALTSDGAGWAKKVSMLEYFAVKRSDHPLAPDMPQEQHDALATEDYTQHKRKMLDLAKDPVPGTHIWRGEVRAQEPVKSARETGVGIHWGVNPDTILRPKAHDGEHEVIYHAEIEHPGEQNFSRSHSMWRGHHMSMDSEAEVRLKPGAKVKLHGVWYNDPYVSDRGPFTPTKPELMGKQWSYTPIGEHVDVAHRPTTDLIDYSDVGVKHEGMLGYFTAAEDDEDYRMQHRPADEEYGAPLHDLTHGGMLPEDVYTHPHYYDYGGEGMGSSFGESYRHILRTRGNPEAKVKIYRSLPAEHAHQGFRPGDWVSTSKEYARQHGRNNDDPKHDWPVISTVVPAKHLWTEGNDLREYGYTGPHKDMPMISFKGGYHQEIRDDKDGWIKPVKRRKPKTADYRLQHQAPDENSGQPYHHHFESSPNEEVRIYRAAPPGVNSLHSDTWVTTDPDYAHQHAEQYDGSPKWPVMSTTVPARHLYWDENDDHEFGYQGPSLESRYLEEHDQETGGLQPFRDREGVHDEEASPAAPVPKRPVRSTWGSSVAHLDPQDHANSLMSLTREHANKVLQGMGPVKWAEHHSHAERDAISGLDEARTTSRPGTKPVGVLVRKQGDQITGVQLKHHGGDLPEGHMFAGIDIPGFGAIHDLSDDPRPVRKQASMSDYFGMAA